MLLFDVYQLLEVLIVFLFVDLKLTSFTFFIVQGESDAPPGTVAGSLQVL